MRLLVVNNIASGKGNDETLYDFLRMFGEDGDEVCMRTTDSTTPIESLVHDAMRFDAVVAAGGDGTITAVAHALAFSGIPILIFPTGTGNLFAQNLDIPFEPPALVKMVREMKTLDFDLGELTAGGKVFGFGMMAGAGYDATIMSQAAPNKKMFGPMAYFGAALANPLPQRSHFRMDIDGQLVETDALGVLLVNFSEIQMEISITHQNKPRDNYFDVVVLKAENAFGLIPPLIAGLLDRDGEHADRSDSLEFYRGKEVYLDANPSMEIQYDGEVPGLHTPCYAHILGSAARFILDENAFNRFSK